MANRVKGIPDNSSVVIPRLVCRDVPAAIEFCVDVLNAVELGRRPGPDGKAVHALLTIGPAMIMIETEWPTLPSRAPALDGTSPVLIFVYVEDVDDRRARRGTRCQSVSTRTRSILGRSHRVGDGSVWSHVDDRHPYRRNVSGGKGTAMVGHFVRTALSIARSARQVL